MKFGRIVWILLAIILLTSPAFSQPVTLVAVGDSLTAGDGDLGAGGGYPARLLDTFQAEYPSSTLANLAISGDTTTDLINKQLDQAVAELNAAPPENRKIAIVWIGSNDYFGLYAGDACTEYYSDLETCEEVETENIYDNIDTILSALEATGASIYIARLDDQTQRPVIADPALRAETFPGITDEEVPRMSTQIQNFNDRVDALAAAHGATTVDFYNTTIFENSALLSDDGNHPNAAGYDAIAQIWYQAITGAAGDDRDGDGTPDSVDGCPDDPAKIEPGVCGCGISDVDSDGDAAADCVDQCPDDPNKTEPGICGCGVAEGTCMPTDSDGDGIPDDQDGCPNDPLKVAPGACGCGVAEGACAPPDADGDGTPDDEDGCPNDPEKIAPGECGCGIAEGTCTPEDRDGDGTPDDEDGCPDDPDKTEPGVCGCGEADIDTDGDGILDCDELENDDNCFIRSVF